MATYKFIHYKVYTLNEYAAIAQEKILMLNYDVKPTQTLNTLLYV